MIYKELLIRGIINNENEFANTCDNIKTLTDLEATGNKLKAKLLGDSTLNYTNLDHIKSPTYHEMYFKKTKDGWEAQVVVDV